MADEIGKLISSEAINELIDKIKANDNNTLNSAKEYSDGLAINYATTAQGNKADSALQSDDIITGDNNGTIKVKNTNISVKGLKSAAYTNSSAYDVAGAAATAETNAKDYADSLASNYDASGAASAAETAAKAYADGLAVNYDVAGAAAAVQAASEPKKITGVLRIPFTTSATSVTNIIKYYTTLTNATSNISPQNFPENFGSKTIIISPADDTAWTIWRDNGIRCSGQTDVTNNVGGLTFSLDDAFSSNTITYANIIIFD